MRSVSRNTYTLIAILVVSAALFVYVAPQYVNRGVDVVNRQTGTFEQTPASASWYKLPHVPDVPFRLGLDLLGGTHLVYEADLSQIKDLSVGDAMQGVRDVVERRVNFFGVSEPVVQVSGANRLIVELAGVKDVNEAIKLIGETPFLEFKEEKTGTDPNAPQNLTVGPDGQLQIDIGANYISTGLNGRFLERAQVVFDQQTNQAQVSLDFNDEGAKLFADVTRRNIGKTVAIFLDGQPISIPVVQNEITDGSAVITGRFSIQEAKLLATRLNSGALPVPIKLISQQTIGASLGEDSLRASLKAGLWSLVFVALFMIFLYRLPGAASIVALAVYTLAVLAIYKLLPVTLTLSGLAGFILSLGIGVDANVLIFARMREELAAGRPLLASIVDGFRRAWPSIRDSHVTTFIGALVLYLFTTSIVKGFALTLGIGVLLSLLTSTVVTRAFLFGLISTRLEKYRWLFS